MGKWGEGWNTVESNSGLKDGWHELPLTGYIYREKEGDNAWMSLQFQGASVGLNFFPNHPAAGHQKAHQISLGKLKSFFECCGCDESTMPDMDPDSIKQALDAYVDSNILVGCRVGPDGRGYTEVKNFRKAK